MVLCPRSGQGNNSTKTDDHLRGRHAKSKVLFLIFIKVITKKQSSIIIHYVYFSCARNINSMFAAADEVSTTFYLTSELYAFMLLPFSGTCRTNTVKSLLTPGGAYLIFEVLEGD